MEEMTVGRRQIISVIFFLEGELDSNINTNQFKNTKHPKQLANTPKYLLYNPWAFWLLHPCISTVAYQHTCCSLMHEEGHIMYFQRFGLFITASGFLYFTKTVLT